MKVWQLGWVTLVVCGLIGTPTQACELADDPNSLEYSLREDNRCEGIQERFQVSGSLDLISLTSTRGGAPRGTSIQVRVPRRDSSQPFFLMQEPESNYRLDNISFIDRGIFYLYNLSTRYLGQIGVDDLDDLRAIAATGTQRVYLPTLLGPPASSYQFVFYSVDRVQFLEAGIRDTTASWGRQEPRRGEKSFTWEEAQNAPAGRYEFYYVAEIEQRNRPPERISRSIAFWHDPSWLR